MTKEYINSVDKDAISQIKEDLNTITSLLNTFEISNQSKDSLLSKVRFYAENIERICNEEGMLEIVSLSNDIIDKINNILRLHDSKYIVIEISNYINNVYIFLERILESNTEDRTDQAFEVSSEMKSLFIAETKENLSHINKILFKLEAKSGNTKPLLDEFYREIHSIKGDANALGFYKIADLAHGIETEITEAQNNNQFVSNRFIDYLFDNIEVLSKILDSVVDNTYFNPSETTTNINIHETNKIEDEVDTSEEFLTMDEIPEEIIDIYTSETSEHLLKINNILLELENDDSTLDSSLEDIYRELHSIKGDSNTLGFEKVGKSAHETESLVTQLQKNEIQFNQKTLENLFEKIRNVQNIFTKVTGYQLDFAENLNDNKKEETENISLDSDSYTTEIDANDEIKLLYGEETKEHISNIMSLLMELENNPEKHILDSIYRELHSVKGDSNTLGLLDIGDNAHQMETIITDLQQSNNVSGDSIDKLMVMLQEIVVKVSKTTGIVIDNITDNLAAETNKQQTVAEAEPESIDDSNEFDEIPEEIKEIYISETTEHLNKINSILLELENSPPDFVELLEGIYRELHSIKGDSNTLGFLSIGELAHKTETVVTQLQKSEIEFNQKNLDILFSKIEILENSFNKVSGLTNTNINNQAEKSENIQIVAQTQTPIDNYIEDLDIPDEIKSLYAEEAKEHVINISKMLLDLETDKDSSKEILDAIYRELHSIKGDSNTLGLTNIGELAHNTEGLVTSLQKNESDISSENIQQLFNNLDLIRTAIVKATNINIDSFNVHSETITNTTQEANNEIIEENLDDISDDIKDIYITETQDHLDKINKIMLELEDSKDMEYLNELYRELHSIKGDSNTLGFLSIGELAHKTETIVTACQKKADIDKDELEALYSQLEKINNIFNKISGKNKSKKEIIVTQNTTKDIKSTTVIKKEILPVFDKTKTENNNKKVLSDALKITNSKTNTSDTKKTTGSGKRSSAKQEDETIRVSTSKIDKIINLSDELLISKIGYDQRLSDMKNILDSIVDYRSSIKNLFKSINPDEQFSNVLEDLQNNLNLFEEKISTNLKEFKKDNYRFSLIVDEVQSDSRNTRMLPASYLIEPLKIVVRNTSKKLNKNVMLYVNGENIEIDRLIIEKLKDPLAHIIRNSLDHGIESSEERKVKNKSEQAKLIIDVSISGNNIIFKISDDGRGINYSKIASKAVKLGMITPEQEAVISEFELNKIMFSPGFSTADQITDVSGRGVGLDVVKATIEGINGNISIASVSGEGTSFILSVPLTLTTFDAILITLADNKYALPKQSVISTMNISTNNIVSNGNNRAILFDNVPIKIVDLCEIMQEPNNSSAKNELTLAIVESGDNKLALIIDEFIESKKMVMKNLGTQLLKVPNISGATIMGDGEPVLVLNIAEIISSIYSDMTIFNMPTAIQTKQEINKKRDKIRILVVDDSITTRTLEKNILEHAGYEVVIGKNGLEGKENVEKYLPDLIITDVEMPKMNGYQFASWVKKESSYKNTPIIMITSLASQEFKMKGLEAGVDAYIVKGEFNQNKLLDTINQLL